MRLGWPEMILIVGLVLIVFGAGKLPQVGAQLGKGIREFRRASHLSSEDGSSPPSAGEVGSNKAAEPK